MNSFMRNFLLMVCFFFRALPLFAGDAVKIEITRDTILQQSIEIPFGTTLVIAPGVKVLFEGYHVLRVNGLIIAEGTPSEPVLFSGVDRETLSREKPVWKGIEIVGKNAHGHFRNCRFEGAYKNLIWESSPSFDSCQFTGNHYGLYCTKKAAPPVQNCRFNRNTYGIAVDFASPLLSGNIITENNVGLHLQLSSSVLAGKNLITGNGKDIHTESAFGPNNNFMSMQRMWDMMRQLF